MILPQAITSYRFDYENYNTFTLTSYSVTLIYSCKLYVTNYDTVYSVLVAFEHYT